MAKFNIYSSEGVLKGVGYPTYTGTYMKPGVLEFREIASPMPIDWAVGDYVGYESGSTIIPYYPRTGHKYTLYSIPQVKRQARNRTYGAAFVYQGVQFYDASYLLTLVPFRDLVASDNQVHFSTQPQIAVFTNVSGIAERLQACLDVDYANQWYIRLATTAMGASQDVVDLMAEYRDFSVSGVTLQGVLDKVYEVWSEIGWVYSYEQVTIDGSSVWRNVITIGGAGLNLNSAPSYLYGKGNGLTSLTRTVANADEMANRIYAYGSAKNMLSGWYRSQQIKDADSVDIQHLMLPIDAVGTQGTAGYYPGWGKTNNLPDAAKAYVEDAESIAARGLREKIIYFDGTGDTEEIYPTIRNMTIKDVRDALGSSSAQYYPSTTVYADQTVRVDRVLSVESTFDEGLAADSGKQTVLSVYDNLTASSPFVLPANASNAKADLLTKAITVPETGKLNLEVSFDFGGAIAVSDGTVSAWLEVKHGATQIGKVDIDVTEDMHFWTLGSVYFSKNGLGLASGDTITAKVWVQVNANATSTSARSYAVTLAGDVSEYLSRYREKTFKITIRQIGFDISEQAALGSGKTIHFRTGKCAGRTFAIKSCVYQATTETWLLEVIRSEDESLSQWFPNSDYPVRGKETSPAYDGDEFVLLDIAMPDSYVVAAEKRLLVAAQDYLAWSKKEVWQYTPEIDAKFMLENSRSIKPAEYMILYDASVVGEEDVSSRSYFMEHNEVYYLTEQGEKILLASDNRSDAVLVDSVTINEGEAAIPTYKVTLRERKRKKASSSAEVQGSTSTPVTSVKEERAKTTTVKSDFFEEDGNGGIKLKDEYVGLWAKGYGTFGGVGSGGGGGGGGFDVDKMYRNLANAAGTDQTYWTSQINIAHIPNITISKITDLSTALADYLPLSGGTMANTNLVTSLNANYLNGRLDTGFLRREELASDAQSYDANSLTQTDTHYTTGFDLSNVQGWSNFPENSNAGSFGLANLKDGSYHVQFFHNYNSANLWVRYQRYYNGGVTWSNWVKLLTSANFVSGTDYVAPSALEGFLPLTGGTLKDNSSETPLAIQSSVNGYAALAFITNDNASHYIKCLDTNSLVYRTNSTDYTVYHSGNSNKASVDWSCYRSKTREVRLFGDATNLGNNQYYSSIKEVYEQASPSYLNPAIVFSTMSNTYQAGSEVERMRIASNGNVGIGTNSPGSKLTVAGDISLYSASGDSPSLFFQRGTMGGTYTDWKVVNQSGSLNFYAYDNTMTGWTNFFTLGGDGNVGVGTNAPTYKLYVNGVAYATTGFQSPGYGVFAASASSSDARLKDNIKSIGYDKAIDMLKGLRGREWEWNNKKEYLAGKHDSGLIAQEVESVMPWMVLDLNGELSLTYNSLWGIAVPAMQYLIEEIKELKEEIKQLRGL